ncbi:5'-nucleotidase [Cellulosimicrobium sp. TH-20]|uniref:5'-nucleotidase n=1 Tax=Cellulosimicrobium sp. TH-20 TaxID=1980001 RepID=UPI0011A0674B|nr:5'-nucleotidase [Cellulosimicrobium sp. TH-20]
MGYDLSGRLVVGVASSALFDLTESDRVFRTQGEAAYRDFQERHRDDALAPGVAFGFVRRLLALNDLAPSADDPLVEVIVMSRNSPETGLRVMRSVRHHDLDITRAVFRQGRSPHEFIRPLHVDLFLSADERSVRDAVDLGLPAGYVLDPTFADEEGDELRIAFDFDGVLADDSSERRYQDGGLASFREHEALNADVPLGRGPLRELLVGIHRVQVVERERHATDPSYRPRVHVSLVTARSAPAHERAVATLSSWGVTVDDAFFLGGVDKGGVLEVLRPHIFFDDQRAVVEAARRVAPSVHVPYGELNRGVLPADPALDARPTRAADAAPPAPGRREAATPPAPGASAERDADDERPAHEPAGERPTLDPAGERTAEGGRASGTGTRELPLVRSVPGIGGPGLAGIAAGVPTAEPTPAPEGERTAAAPDARADTGSPAASGDEQVDAPTDAGTPAPSGATLLSRRDARPGAPDRVSVLGPAGEPKPLPVRPSSNGGARHH